MAASNSTPDLEQHQPRCLRGTAPRASRAIRNLEVGPCIVLIGMMYALKTQEAEGATMSPCLSVPPLKPPRVETRKRTPSTW